MKHGIYWIFYFATGLSLPAQEAHWRLSGTVLDGNGEALPGVSLSVDDSAHTVSDAAGIFQLRPAYRPRILTARCIGYFPQRIPLDTVPFEGRAGRLRVVLQSNAVNLPEVGITARALEPIFQEDFQTDLLDYEFAGKYLALLLRERNRYFLRLADDDGRKLSELRLPEPAQYLHQSCTGDFHAVGTDWTWEFTLRDTRMDTFPRYASAKFHQLVEPCVLEQQAYYFFRETGPFRQSVRYTYYDPAHQPHLLAVVRNELAEAQLVRRYRAILREYMKTLPDVDQDDILSGLTPFTDMKEVLKPENLIKMAESNELVSAIGFFNLLAEDSVYAPLVRIGAKLYLFDHVNDKLIRIDAVQPWQDEPGNLHYHRQPGWNKQVLVDAALERAYGRFSGKDGTLILKEIDLKTGSANKTYRLTIAPYLSSAFRIRNGILYFIGQPDVNVPNRQLYKMNIFKFAE